MANKIKEFHDEVVAFMAGYNPAPATPKLVSVPVQSGTLTYSGAAKTPTWSGYDSTQLTLGGTTSATNAGTYTATFTLKDGYAWADGTSNPKSVSWTIGKATPTLTLSATSDTVTYGTPKTFTVTQNTSGGTLSVTSASTSYATATISGTTVTVNCVQYRSATTTITVTAAATANYNAVTATYTMTAAKATPTLTLSKTSASVGANGTATFTVTTPSDGTLSVTSSSSAIATATISGTTVTVTGKSAGNATITVTAAASTNYNAATASCAVSVALAALNLTASISGAVTYNSTGTISISGNTGGGAITATSSNTSVITVVSTTTNSVTVKAVNGTGNATITISVAATANYAAGSTTCVVTAAKATPTLTLSSTSSTVTKGGYATFTVTTPSDGALSVTSSDTDVATATIEGNTVTVVGKESNGSATITVSQAAGTNYAAPESKNYVVQCRAPKAITDSWATISTRSKNGTAHNYYDIGDYKEITLNGKIGDCLELTNEKLRVFILHFNYPMDNVPENNIIWGGFKTADGTDVALCDSKYDNYLTDGTICFNMNHWGKVNYGGWKGCDFRYDILGATSTAPSDYGTAHTESCVGYNATAATLTSPKANTLLAALPSDFRNALRLWSRWIDAKGNSSNVEANIEETIDAVTLLSGWESHGVGSSANKYEKNHQTQMDYYKNGNAKIKNNPASTSSTVWWWLASPSYYNNNAFCYENTDGSTLYASANHAGCLAPAFKT